jgi:hypothetical protein
MLLDGDIKRASTDRFFDGLIKQQNLSIDEQLIHEKAILSGKDE